MDYDKAKRIRQMVDYANEEMLFGEDKQLMFFESMEDLVEALREGKVPGVKWTEECEAKWQAEQSFERTYEDYDDPWGAQL